MRYVIAGGGEFGTHYVRKIRVAIARRALTLEGVIVVDRDPECAARAEIRRLSIARLHVGDWTTFGDHVWLDRIRWQDDIWVPAPIAPHILSEWILARMRRELHLTAVPAEPPPLPPIPYARVLDDGRMLLSHAPGLCPVDCIEPEVCAITGERRFWEMRHTLATLTTALGRPDIAMFFCRHHCNVGQYDVGGIRFRTIYEESDRIMAAVRGGGQQFGVATFSSCHGVLNLFRVEGRPMTDAAIGSGGSARRTCQSCGAVFQCGPATGNSVCWCERRPHVLPAAGTACFCPACLEVLITEAITTQRKRPG